MGGKHLKRLRAEKSKVKFKKKSLPKGQNITNVNFQVKKIVTVEQYKKIEENEPVTSWNLSLKDLLARLNHYNSTSRLNSLGNMKELILKHPTLLEGPSLHCIITRILALITDVEHKIRVTAIKLLDEVFAKMQYKSIIPFYDILKLYVDCAMTHREFSIQQDSLKLIDVIIKFAPEAIRKNPSAIIYNFTRILANYKYGYHSDATFSKKSKEDLESSKSDMFKKFYQLLKITYGTSKKKTDNSLKHFKINSIQCGFNLKKVYSFYQKNPDLSNLFKHSSENEYISKKSETSAMQNKISIIMPVLFDTWLESGPSQEDRCLVECALKKNRVLLLESLLKILLLLYEEIICLNDPQLKNWFVSTYASSFLKTFMINFPYQEPFLEENNSSVLCEISCVKQNLILCYLFHCFKAKNFICDKETEVENYVLSCLKLKNPNGIKILPRVIEILLNCGKKKLYDDLLIRVVKTYDSTENINLQHGLFNILLKEALANRKTNAKMNEAIANWKMSLPKKLLEKEVTSNVIEGILQIVMQDEGRGVLEEIQKKAHQIIKAVSCIEIEDANSLENKKLLAHLLYRCRGEVLQDILEKKILEDINSQEIRNYFLNIFSYKLNI